MQSIEKEFGTVPIITNISFLCFAFMLLRFNGNTYFPDVQKVSIQEYHQVAKNEISYILRCLG